MAFKCPECKNPNSLNITEAIELPPDSRSDEIALQIIRCGACDFQGIAVYEESRRGALGQESYNHFGFHTNKDVFYHLVKLIKKCPSPINMYCTCETHQELGIVDKSGRWIGTYLIEPFNSFPIG